MNTDGTQINTSAGSGNPYAAPQTEVCQQTENVSCYYLSLRFWLSAFFGWFAAAIVLSLFVSIAGLSELGGNKSVAVGVIVHVLAALIGFFDARWRWNQKNKITT